MPVVVQFSAINHVLYEQVYGEGFEDMRRRVPSLDKARRLLGYHSARDLRQIIRDVAASLKSAPSAAGSIPA